MRALVIFIAMFVHFAVSKPARSSDYPGAIPDLRVARGTGLIAEAWLADPTTRYRHFVLGSDYEAASLVVRTRDGDLAKLTLPRNAVFEDRQPRLADIDGDGVDEIIVVRSDPRRGAALVVVALVDGKLAVRWESEPTGRANTWLNPAGIADFDGDGRLDIAYVQMPHVLGLLRVWTLRKGQFEEMAQLPGFSNHEIGSPHLGLSAVADFDGDGVADLALPSLDRRTLRFIRFAGGVREIAQSALIAPAAKDFRIEMRNSRPVVLIEGALK